MRESKKYLSKWIVYQEVIMREAEIGNIHRVLDPPLLRGLSDGVDPSIMLDLIAAIQRRKGLD